MLRHPSDRRQVLAGNLRLLRRSPMLLLIGSVFSLCAVSTCALAWVGLANRAQPATTVTRFIVTAPPRNGSGGPSPGPTVGAGSRPAEGLAWTPALVVRVVDGDTLIVAINATQTPLRLIGMDTPETVHPTKPVQCFGAEATARMQQIVNSVNGQVWLEKDVSETDRYTRLLRYVWLGPNADSPLLNEQLVAEGYAQVSTFPPDVKYQEPFLIAERAARAAQRGLWGVCGSFGRPLARPTPAVTRSSP